MSLEFPFTQWKRTPIFRSRSFRITRSRAACAMSPCSLSARTPTTSFPGSARSAGGGLCQSCTHSAQGRSLNRSALSVFTNPQLNSITGGMPGPVRTVIEADVHIGSYCVLVAPITIGAGGTVGGGSTLTKSTEPGSLSVARGKQVSIAGWQRPVKQKKS